MVAAFDSVGVGCLCSDLASDISFARGRLANYDLTGPELACICINMYMFLVNMTLWKQ